MLTWEQFKEKYPEIYKKAHSEGITEGRAREARSQNSVLTTKPSLSFEEEIKVEWDANPKLRAEFRTFDIYSAYRQGVASGRVRRVKPRQGGVHEPRARTQNLAPTIKPSLSLEEEIKAEWDASPELQAEFRTFDIYSAYRQGVASGRVRRVRPRYRGDV